MEAFKPTPALADCITDIWVWEIESSAQQGDAASLTLLPDGHPAMCFVYGAPLTASDGQQSFTTRSAVCGFQTRPVQVTCAGRAAGVTVRFKPWSLPLFVQPSLEEAAERRIHCRDLFGDGVVEALESELFELPSSLARVRRVERFLLALLRAKNADPLIEKAVHQLCGGGYSTRVGQVARDLGASERTLERRFRRAIGVAPKQFSRVMRLQSALTLQAQAQPVRWSELALDAGFYDQAHLIRETRELFGTTPSTLLAPLVNPVAQGFQDLAREVALPSSLFR
jgi:AraC-like DNA-binding protein